MKTVSEKDTNLTTINVQDDFYVSRNGFPIEIFILLFVIIVIIPVYF